MDGEQSPRNFQDLASANPFDLNDQEIKKLISDCSMARRGYLQSVTPNVRSLNEQIELAQHVLTARESQKLARLSLAISTLAIVASAVGLLT